MASFMDRALQRELLLQMQDENRINLSSIDFLFKGRDRERVIFNMQYLEEHGLVENIIANSMDGVAIAGARITARGLDFLADDGGLSAVLGVVTIKLHHDTLVALLETRVKASDLPPAAKASLLQKLKEQPAEALSHLTTKLVDLAFEKGPAGIQLLCTTLGHLPVS